MSVCGSVMLAVEVRPETDGNWVPATLDKVLVVDSILVTPENTLLVL